MPPSHWPTRVAALVAALACMLATASASPAQASQATLSAAVQESLGLELFTNGGFWGAGTMRFSVKRSKTARGEVVTISPRL